MLSAIYSSKKHSEEGFTLIELLVVVIIIGILAAIALPIFINQQRAAVDASVVSDVRNTVAQVIGAQSLKQSTAKATVSKGNNKVALTAIPLAAPAGTAARTVVATAQDLEYDNVPAIGSPYTIEGWNTGAAKYLGTAEKPAFTYNSITGKFTQGVAAAPADEGDTPTDDPTGDQGDGGGVVGGGTPSTPAPSFAITTTSVDNGIVDSQYRQSLATENGDATSFTADGLPSGLNINDSGVISGRPSAAGTFTVKVTAKTAADKSDDQELTIKINPNLLANASFENGSYPAAPTPWSVTGGNVVHNDTMNCPQGDVSAHSGNNWLLFYSGNPGTNNVDLAQGVNTTVAQGQKYSAGGWVSGCSAAGQSGQVYLVANDNGNYQTIGYGTYNTSAAGWSYVNVSGTSPIDASGMYVQFVPNVGQGNIAFDDFNIGALG